MPHRQTPPAPFLRPLLGAIALLCCTLSAAAEQHVPDLRDIARENREIAALIADIETGRQQRLTETDDLRGELTREERELQADAVTPEMLREARLKLDTLESRLVVLQGRIDQRRLSLGRLREQLAELQRLPPVADGDNTRALRREAAEALLTEQASLTERVIAAYGELLAVADRYRRLLSERLRLLQSRLRLHDFDHGLFAADKRLPLLESVINEHMHRATRFARRRGEITGADTKANNERLKLDVQIDDAVTRSFLRQNDLELILAEDELQDLETLREDNLMPLHVLRDAERRLLRVGAALTHVEGALASQRRMLEGLRDAVRHESTEDTESRQVLTDLQAMLDFQQTDVQALQARVERERKGYARAIGDSYAAGLTQQHPLPETPADWRRLGDNALHLPALLGQALNKVGRELREAIARAAPVTDLLAALGGIGIVLALLLARRKLKATALAQPRDSRLALLLRPLARVAPMLIPAALWLLLGSIYGIPPTALWTLFLLLALWPLLAFTLALVRRLLFRQEPPEGRTDERRRFYRRLRLGLLLATLVAALYILARSLPVAPILADVLDRLAMLGVLALVMPASALRALLQHLGTSGPRGARPRMRFLAWVSRALPLFLTGTGLLGLVGYTELAWVVMTYFAWAVAVGLLLFLVIGLLLDARERLAERLARTESDLGDFWTTQFVEPGYRLGVLLATLGAGWLLFRLWGWSAETSVVRGFLGLINRPLFELGKSSFDVADILLAVFLVGGAFYVGGWSQQVSYNLAYRRISDTGLRQALATFTQYVVIVAGLLLALRIIGFDLTTLAVFAGALGVGIGFGLQNIVNNFVSGLLLLAERPLKAGDFVSIGSNIGTVSRIGMRSLTMRTLDQQEVIIPNGSVISGEFTNWTRSDDLLRNVHYIPIRRSDDPELAIRLIREVLEKHPHVLSEPAPGCFLWEYGESSANLRVQYCFRMNFGPGGLTIRSEVLLAIGRALHEHGIEMPYPRRDVALHISTEDRGRLAAGGDAAPLPAAPG
ncbi:MAG: mechanosensitive ion channel [Thiohalocapsa sp.]|uniref:mechanosensitive ion channel domain-containing protein n=1 Tax=Thiohalocapsa sp. TaxID=2497641 RepID=UPI0025DDFFD9|nr:mechanosensitive ion channel domain-containing protein [Thiohalocapsa sp.]MCG6943114.1 mechanosensitive ion channel [Thiohalocapsa sp.]